MIGWVTKLRTPSPTSSILFGIAPLPKLCHPTAFLLATGSSLSDLLSRRMQNVFSSESECVNIMPQIWSWNTWLTVSYLHRSWSFTSKLHCRLLRAVLTAQRVSVIRSQGLGPLRPEKGWRPIVTVVFDQQHHEIVLGSDGQNPNQKRPFYLWVPCALVFIWRSSSSLTIIVHMPTQNPT